MTDQQPPATSQAVRIAAVDIGSNTTRLVVADVQQHAGGSLSHTVVARDSEITRLAEQVNVRGILLPQAISRTRNALGRFRQVARESGAVLVLATATSAVRDSDNGEAFLGEVEYGYGFRTELLSGDDEATLTYVGVTSDAALRDASAEGAGWLIDIGGGSTEIVLTEQGTICDHVSFQLGSVRLTEQFLDHAPLLPAHTKQARQHVRGLLEQRFASPQRPDLAVGVAGTVTTALALSLGLEPYDREQVHGARLERSAVETCVQKLAAMPVAQRADQPGLEPGRAPVIVGGLITLAECMTWFQLDSLVVSEADILDGIALRAGRIALDEGITELHEPFGRTVC